MKKLKEILNDKRIINILYIFTSVVYALVLCRGLLFKYVNITELFSTDRFEYIGYNLIPFNGRGFDYRLDLIINTLLFIPYGFLLSMKSKKNLKSFLLLLIPFASSIVFESLQYIFRLGAADVTDIIMNTIGGCIGFMLYFVIYKLFGNKPDKFFAYAMGVVGIFALILLY